MRTLVVIPLLLPISMAIAVPQSTAAERCTPYARVVQSQNPRFPEGYGFCAGQTPALNASQPLRVACVSGLDSFWVRTLEDLRRCTSSRPPIRRCSSSSALLCDRLRTNEAKKPTLVKPYGHNLRGSSLRLAWQPVPTATSYQAVLWTDRPYTAMTNSTELLNSDTFPALQPGQTVQIVIRALNSVHQELGNSVTTFRVLSQTVQQDVAQVIARIDRLNASPLEKTYLSLAVLRTHFLVDEGIQLLEQRILELPPTSKLNRLLADLYFEMGHLSLARRSYEQAQQIAIETENSAELALAGQGLRELQALYNHDPTKTIPPQ